MLNKVFVIIWILLSCGNGVNAGALDRIQKSYQKGDYEKVEKLARRSLEKQPLNPGAKYYLSLLFLEEAYTIYNIDSAFQYINEAQVDFERAPPEVGEELLKAELGPAQLEQQSAAVDDAAFAVAVGEMAIGAFDHYLEKYAASSNDHRAVFLRDSLAFDKAAEVGTWQAYEAFFQQYPQSEFSPGARTRYQSLIFKDYTRDDKLESYVRFLDEHPDTPFRGLAEEVIFERSTVRNDWRAYWDFLRKYPKTHLRLKIADLLYYRAKATYPEQIKEVMLVHPRADSLEAIHALEQKVLVPVSEGGKFGFMDLDGEIVLHPAYLGVSQNYLCGNVTSEWLEVMTEKGVSVYNRSGDLLLDNVERIKHVGASTKLVYVDRGVLYHSSGWQISELGVDDAQELDNGWICFQHDYEWGVMTPAGHQVLKPDFHSIQAIGDFLVLESGGAFAVTSVSELAADGGQFLEFVYDDFEIIQDSLAQVFSGELEGLINAKLETVVPLAGHRIYFDGPFWYVKDSTGYRLLDREDLHILDPVFEKLEVNSGWFAFKKPAEWLLISRVPNSVPPQNMLDSVKLLSKNAAYVQEDGVAKVVFQNGQVFPLDGGETIRILGTQMAASESKVDYLLIEGGKGQKVLDKGGQVLFEGKFEEVSLLTDTLFRVKKDKKMGIINHSGEQILPFKYEVLDNKEGMVFLLLNGQIGALDLVNGALLPTDYEARIERIGNHYEVKKEGKLGVVDARNQWLLPAVYDRLMSWNDTACWAMVGTGWSLVSFQNETILSGIISVRPWLGMEMQQLAIVIGENGYGLMSNVAGEILPMQYNDILNLGTSDRPLFFAEQHLKTAAFFVVTYFNLAGEAIRSQAFRPEEYDRIYCDQ